MGVITGTYINIFVLVMEPGEHTSIAAISILVPGPWWEDPIRPGMKRSCSAGGPALSALSLLERIAKPLQ